MNRAERYIYTVYRLKSFSKAAKELYISQPSLSATVKKHEAELGFLIFNRSKTPITLTPEGEIFMEYLDDSIENEKNMRHRINSLSKLSTEKLQVGGTNFLARVFLPKICGEFHRRFPDVEIKIDLGESGSVNGMEDKVENGLVECILTYRHDEARHGIIHLFDDRLVIAIRKDTPGAEKLLPYALTRDEIISGKRFPEKEADFSLFSDFEFIRYGKTSGIGSYTADFMENCRISPCYSQNAKKYDIKYDMMLEGMGSVIVSEVLIKLRPDRCDEVYYFLPKGPFNKRQAKIVYKKDAPLSGSAKEFIKIAQQMLADF